MDGAELSAIPDICALSTLVFQRQKKSPVLVSAFPTILAAQSEYHPSSLQFCIKM